MRWRWPADRALPGVADLGLVAVGQRRGSAHGRSPPWRAAITVPTGHRARSARCSGRRCRRTAPRPAAGSRCAGRASRATTGRARRRRCAPCRAAAGHTPTIARTSDDLPEALGPMTPTPWPALSWKATPCTTRRLVARRADAHRLDRQRLLRPGSSMRGVLGRHRAEQAVQPPPALARRRRSRCQCAMATSTGASARAVRIELAMMMPAVAC